MRQDAMTTKFATPQSKINVRSIPLMIVFIMMVTATNFGCATRTTVNAPLVGPYPADKTWAIAPLNNDTGTSAANGLHLSDLLARELQQVYRINVLPVNRVLDAMYNLQIEQIQSVHDAQAIVRILQVDGLIVGNITAYDPYSPPVLGMTLQLYTSGLEFNADNQANQSLNTAKGVRTLGASPSDSNIPGLQNFTQPVASATAVVNAADNAIRLDLQAFAQGRTDPDSALGWREYLYSMDAYAQYVGHRLIKDLLIAERRRLGNRRFTSQPNPAQSRNNLARLPQH